MCDDRFVTGHFSAGRDRREQLPAHSGPLIGHLAGLEQHVKVLVVKVGVAAPAFIEQLDQVQGFLRQSPFPGLVHWECLYVKHMTWQGVSHV